MKIKVGTVHKDVTAYGNKYYIQIEDSRLTSNNDLEEMVGKPCSVVIGPIQSIDQLLQEVEIL